MGLLGFLSRKSKDEPTDIEKKIRLCQGYAKLWSDYFAYFSDRLEGVTITDEKEDGFFRVMSTLALRIFEFDTRMGDDFRAEKQLRSLLADTCSLAHMQLMSEAEFSTMQVRWHEVFIELHKTRGRLMLKMPVVHTGHDTKGKTSAPAPADGA